MLLIDSLIEVDDKGGHATTTLDDDCIGVASGIVDPLIGVELMAQAFAAVKGWENLIAGEEFPNGFLVGVRKYEPLAPIPAHKQLNIHVTIVGEFENFAVVTGTVSCEGQQLATGKIKLWVPEEDK